MMPISSSYILIFILFALSIPPRIKADDPKAKKPTIFCGKEKCDTFCADRDSRCVLHSQVREYPTLCRHLELGQETLTVWNSVCCKPKGNPGFCSWKALRCGKCPDLFCSERACRAEPGAQFCHQYSDEQWPVCISNRTKEGEGKPFQPYKTPAGLKMGLKDRLGNDVEDVKAFCAKLPDDQEYHVNDNEWCCRVVAPHRTNWRHQMKFDSTCAKLSLLCGLSACSSKDPPYCEGKGSLNEESPYEGSGCALQSIAICDGLEEGQTLQYKEGRWCTRPRKEDLRKRLYVSRAHAFCAGAPCSQGVTHCIRAGTKSSRCAEKEDEKLKCRGTKDTRLVSIESGVNVSCCITGECSIPYHEIHRCGNDICDADKNPFCEQRGSREAFCSEKNLEWDQTPCSSLKVGEEYLMYHAKHSQNTIGEPVWCCRPRVEQVISMEPTSCSRKAIWCGESGCKKPYCIRNGDLTSCPENEEELIDTKCSASPVELAIAPSKWCCRPTEAPFTCLGTSLIAFSHFCGTDPCLTYCVARNGDAKETTKCSDQSQVKNHWCQSLEIGQEALMDAETVCCKPNQYPGYCLGKAVKCGDELCKAEPGLQFCSQFTSENKAVCMGSEFQGTRAKPLKAPFDRFRDHHNKYIRNPYKFCADLAEGQEYHMNEDEWCCKPAYNPSGSTSCQKKSLLCAFAICRPTDMPYCIEIDRSDMDGTETFCASYPISKCNNLKEGEELQYAKLEWCYKPTEREARRKVYAPLEAAWCGSPCAVGVTHCIRREGAQSKCAEEEHEKAICTGPRWGQFVKFENGSQVTCCRTSQCSHQLVHRCGTETCLDSALCVDPFLDKPKCSSYFDYPGWPQLTDDCGYLSRGEELRASESQWCCRPTSEEEADISTLDIGS